MHIYSHARIHETQTELEHRTDDRRATMSRLPAMDAASSSGASSDSEMNDAMPLEAPEVDEATFAARRAEILVRSPGLSSLLSSSSLYIV